MISELTALEQGNTNNSNGSDLAKSVNEIIATLTDDIKSYGAIDDGVTDNTAAFITALNSGNKILIKGGGLGYICGDVGTINNINIIGEDEPLIIGLSATLTGDVRINSIKFDSTTELFTLKGGMDIIEIKNNDFTTTRRAIYYTVADAGNVGNISICDNKFHDTVEVESENTIGVSIRYPLSIASAIIERNVLFNMFCPESFIFYGIWIGADPRQDDHKNIVFKSNVAYNVGINSELALTIGHVFRGQGFNVSMGGNIVNDCKWVNALYGKTINGVFDHNIINNSYGGGISIKEAQNVVIADNVIIGASQYRAAIRLIGRGIVSNNEVDINIDPLLPNDTDAGFAFETTSGTTSLIIDGNNLKSPKGLKIIADGVVSISGGTIENTDPLFPSVFCKSGVGTLKRLSIQGVDITSNIIAISTNTGIEKIIVKDNSFIVEGVVSQTPINLFASKSVIFKDNEVELTGSAVTPGSYSVVSVSGISGSKTKTNLSDNEITLGFELDNVFNVTIGNQSNIVMNNNTIDGELSSDADRSIFRIQTVGTGEPNKVRVNNNDINATSPAMVYLDYTVNALTNYVEASRNSMTKPLSTGLVRCRNGSTITSFVADNNIFSSGAGTILAGTVTTTRDRITNNDVT